MAIKLSTLQVCETNTTTFKDLRLTWTDCDEAEAYVVPNVLSPRDLLFRPDIMDETVKSSSSDRAAQLWVKLETLCPQQMLVHKGGQIKNWVGSAEMSHLQNGSVRMFKENCRYFTHTHTHKIKAFFFLIF